MKRIDRILLSSNFCLPFQKMLDRLLFHLFFKRYYRRKFKKYGENVRWGAHSSWYLIPKTIRISCPEKISIGDNVSVDDGVYLQCHEEGQGIVLGNGSRINAHTHVLSYDEIHIGEKVLIAPFCLIVSGNHASLHARAIMDSGMTPSGPVKIGAGSWLGQGATLLGGTTIGERSIVGARAVIKGEFPAESKIVGPIKRGH